MPGFNFDRSADKFLEAFTKESQEAVVKQLGKKVYKPTSYQYYDLIAANQILKAHKLTEEVVKAFEHERQQKIELAAKLKSKAAKVEGQIVDEVIEKAAKAEGQKVDEVAELDHDPYFSTMWILRDLAVDEAKKAQEQSKSLRPQPKKQLAKAKNTVEAIGEELKEAKEVKMVDQTFANKMPQIFVNLPFSQYTKVLNFAAVPNGKEIYESVLKKFPAFESSRFLLLHQSKIVTEDFYFNDSNEMPITLTALVPVLGGKGGFGSQLKSLGNRIAQKKVTNYESSRDLSGRRLRTVNEARKLADYIADAPKRKKEEEEKLEKEIKRAQQMQETKVVEVDHSEYLEKLEKVEGEVESAVKMGKSIPIISGLKKVPLKAALKVGKKVQKKTSSAWKDDLSSSEEEDS